MLVKTVRIFLMHQVPTLFTLLFIKNALRERRLKLEYAIAQN